LPGLAGTSVVLRGVRLTYGRRQLYVPRLAMLEFSSVLFVLGVLIAADMAWAAFRDHRARRLPIKRGRTLTAKYALPPVLDD